MHLFSCLFLCGLLPLMSQAETETLTLESGPYKLRFASDRAWTIHSIEFDGKNVGLSNGFYGTVMTPKGGKWWGTGHTEGGREQVRSLLLTVDGKPAPPGGGRSYKGKDLVLVKESTIWKFSARALVRVQKDFIVERTEMKALEDCELNVLYYFMHCFPPSTTKWLAEDPSGALDEGPLTHSDKMAVTRNTRWVAQYDPALELSMLCYTPKVITGPRSASMIWDKERYHKYYLQQNRGQAFQAGDRLDFTVVVKMDPNETGDWTATKATAKELKKLFPISGVKQE